MLDDPSGPEPVRSTRPGGSTLVELVRLTVVALSTAAGFQLTAQGALPRRLLELMDDSTARLLLVTLGAAVGYVLGGVVGRFTIGRIDVAERRLREVSAGELLAGMFGAMAGLAVGAGITWPVLLFEGRAFTLPIAALIIVVMAAAGLRIGSSRGGDLLRFVGASGRLGVSSPSSGRGAKLIDTAALIDGRLLEVCRAGFCEGTLVVPEFVLYELQGLADSGDDERRRRGRRGLDTLGALQRASGVALEVAIDEVADVESVDAKLITLARSRRCALVTVDANLARIAEVQGIRVLNLHTLAEELRPPVLPGDHLTVRIARGGKEPGQGVGYLSDGTMVVVEGAAERIGADVVAEVTSLLSNPNGRMVFATACSAPTPLGDRAVTA